MIEQLNVTKDRNQMTRGQRIWDEIIDLRSTARVSLNRAKLVTEAYKETEGQPVYLRRARAHERVLLNLPIRIDHEQLLCGDFASECMGFEWWPELYSTWVIEAIDNNWFTYEIDGTTEEVREICDYWRPREGKNNFLRYLDPEFREKLETMNEKGALCFFAESEASLEKGWHVPNYEKVIKIGLKGILKEIQDELDKTPIRDNDSYRKVNLLRGLKISLNAAIQYSKRYAVLCKEEAEKESDPKRKKELEVMADMCDYGFENGARTFWEAVQIMFFTHICIFMDVRCSGMSFGRVDQYLYPYYKADIEAGRTTHEEAVEVLECLRCKCSMMRQFDSKTAVLKHDEETKINDCRSGETQFHNCTLGGQTVMGVDAVNEMSFMWLEAAMNVRTAHPTLTIRWHPALNEEFKMAAARLNKLGLGFPAWYNDLSTIPYMLERGCSYEDAMNYVVSGCVLHTIPYKSPSSWPGITSMGKIFEITLNNGIDPRTGKQTGPQTGDVRNMTFEELWEAYFKQVKYFFDFQSTYLNMVRVFRSHELPNLFLSALFDDCIQRGDGVFGGGCHYQISAQYLQPIGFPDVADSLAAIKKCIYEDKSVTWDELMDALKADFVGYEDVHELLLDAPKFGNDDDYVDLIMKKLYQDLFAYAHNVDSDYGSKYEVAPHSLSFHGAAGSKVGALPSGRTATKAMNDAGCSACQGMDSNGPSALINSAGKIEHTEIYGCLFNIKMHPSAMQTDDDLHKFLNLIDTYFGEYLGKHVQFNVVDRETLLAAQKEPKKYKNLVVRVAGYSALFVELNPQVQRELIDRTEVTF